MKGRLLAAWCFLALGCSPFLTPVSERQPAALMAQLAAPRVIWLLDTSGSLEIPLTPCPAWPTCGTPSNRCPASCPTRIGLLKNGMRTFEAQLPPSTQQVLIKYPIDALCTPPNSPEAGRPDAGVIDTIDALVPMGGTRTWRPSSC